MKQFQYIRAYSALLSLDAYKLPMRTAYDIYTLRKKIEPIYMFEVDKEKSLIDKYKIPISADGMLAFQNDDVRRRFSEDIKELKNIEIEMEIEPIRVDIHSFGEQQISPSYFDCLEGFVVFE